MILREERHKTLPKCKVEDCNNRATRISYGLCEACYYRLRRHGSTKRRKPKYKYKRKDGYTYLFKPGHPIATKLGRVFEHRYVFYEDVGGAEPACFWCGCSVGWDKSHIDHLNENKNDNRIENLVYSCGDCNRARGMLMPFIKRLTPKALDYFYESIETHHDMKTATEGAFGRKY